MNAAAGVLARGSLLLSRPSTGTLEAVPTVAEVDDADTIEDHDVNRRRGGSWTHRRSPQRGEGLGIDAYAPRPGYRPTRYAR